MNLPTEAAVMTLPNVTLFPQALLPLYIFEPRYQRMLADALAADRVFSVAMLRPGAARETPAVVAGLGLIRVSVAHQDGTSHLVLQGLARVAVGRVVRYKPYRVHRIRPLETPPCDNVAADALLEKARELVHERFSFGLPFPFPFLSKAKPGKAKNNVAKDVLKYLDSIADPDRAADLFSSTVLAAPRDRQTILEAPDVQTRLRWLIKFLLRDIRKLQQDKPD